jgi:hypothetical protein
MFETGAAVFDLQPPLHVVLDILYLYSILYSTVQYSTVQYSIVCTRASHASRRGRQDLRAGSRTNQSCLWLGH